MTTDADKRRQGRLKRRERKERDLTRALISSLAPGEIEANRIKRQALIQERRIRHELWANNPHPYVNGSPTKRRGAHCTCERPESHPIHTVKT
jgi:hypothetical protein